MAVITPQVNQFYPPAYCARLENLGRKELVCRGLSSDGLQPTDAELALGLKPGAIADQALQLGTLGYVEFEVKAQTETNDTVTTFNLSDLGVDFNLPALVLDGAGAIRRVAIEAYLTSDAEACILKRDALMVCGTTPVVVQTAITRIVDPAGTAAEIGNVGGGGAVIATGDFWGAATTLIIPTVGLEQSGNKIRLTFTGVTNVDMSWTIRVRVYPKISQKFLTTD